MKSKLEFCLGAISQIKFQLLSPSISNQSPTFVTRTSIHASLTLSSYSDGMATASATDANISPMVRKLLKHCTHKLNCSESSCVLKRNLGSSFRTTMKLMWKLPYSFSLFISWGCNNRGGILQKVTFCSKWRTQWEKSL